MSPWRPLLVLAVLGPAASSQWLHDPQPCPTGDAPRRLAAADLDGDGRADLVALGGGVLPSLTVLMGQADGSFGPAAWQAAFGVPSDVALGDITGDGIPDAVSALPDLDALVVQAGDGAGGLLAPLTVNAGGAARRLVLADLDLDGTLDAITANGADQSLSRLFNVGGALGAGTPTPLGADVDSLAVRLLNGDALPDVLALVTPATGPQTFLLLPGLGGGALGPAQIALAQDASGWDLADLDGDGDLDLASASAGQAHAAKNGGAGLFTPGATVTVGSDLRGVAAADFDLDGHADLALASHGDDTLRLLRGDGTGGFAIGVLDLVTGGPEAIVSADFGGDGRPDAAVTAEAHDLVDLLTANDARLRYLPSVTVAAGDLASGLSLADLDGDGDADALTESPKKQQLIRQLNNGQGVFVSKKTFGATHPKHNLVGDLNGDGDLDAIVWGQDISIYENDGHANFAYVTDPALPPGTHDPAALRDFDGDGHVDLLLTGYQAMFLAPGDGVGGFLTAKGTPSQSDGVFGVGDLDGDADLDLVAAYDDSSEVVAWLNDGSGQFTPQPGVRTGPLPLALLVGDFDDDGHADAAVALPAGGLFDSSLALLSGDGHGGLGAPVHVSAPSFSVCAAADFNGDGRPDVAGASSFAGVTTIEQLHVLAGGPGGLQRATAITDAAGGTGLAAADLDGDGRIDLASTHPDKNLLIVTRNASEPHPWHDLGHALGAKPVPPRLAPSSWAEPGTPGALRLSEARPGAVAVLLLSSAAANAPFKGGVLVPAPPLVAYSIAVDAQGDVSMPWLGWPALATGETFYLQAAVADVAGPQGVTLSNALKLVQP